MLFEIAAIAVLLYVYWCTCRRRRQCGTHSRSLIVTGQPCIAAEQESSTGEPAELVISTLQSVPQAVERDGSIYVQAPVAETNRDAVAELAL